MFPSPLSQGKDLFYLGHKYCNALERGSRRDQRQHYKRDKKTFKKSQKNVSGVFCGLINTLINEKCKEITI